MNVNDFKAPDYVAGDALKQMFDRQLQLETHYATIEAKNGFPHPQGSLDDHMVQDRMKHLAWCVTEELVEMMDTYRNKDHVNRAHTMEEYCDALHFMLALLIEVDTHTDILKTILEETLEDIISQVCDDGITEKELETMPLPVIYRLGMAMHKLKSKRWKSSIVDTDLYEFMKWICRAWSDMVLLGSLIAGTIEKGNEPEIIFNYYFRKSEVNKFRQESNY